MALRLTFTDRSEVTHTNSFWVFHELTINAKTKTGRAELLGFKDSDARDNEKAPIEAKEYVIDHKNYDTYFSEAALSPLGKTPITQSILLARETKDELNHYGWHRSI